MAATRRRSTSSRASASITSAPRPTGFLWHASPRPRRRSRSRWETSSAVVITIFVHRNGQTEQATSIDRTWLEPEAGVILWVDLAAPSVPESLVLSDTFGFHPLSVEDALSA